MQDRPAEKFTGKGDRMRYRLATLEDCMVLTELRMEMRKERDPQFCREALYDSTLSFFRRNIVAGRHVAFLCEDQGRVVATAGLSLFEMPPTGKLSCSKVAKLMNMYTIPSYRHRGIAHEMLKMVADYAREIGYGKIMLNSSDMGRPLYEKFGFSLIPNEYEFYL